VTAEEGRDFAGGAGRLVFDVGEQQATIVVYLRDDEIAEDRETLVVQLLGPSTASATITIVDDDGAVGAMTSATEGVAPAAAPPPAAAAPTPAAAPPADVVRRRLVATRPATPTPRRVTVRQSPVTPFELRPAPGTFQGAYVVNDRTAVDKTPDILVEAAELLLHVEKFLRVVDRSKNLGAVSYDAGIAEQSLDLAGIKARDFRGIEPGKGGAICIALA
jgi:hypothetical protein